MLSTYLFNRYINDLTERLTRGGYAAFYSADDLAVIVHRKARVGMLIELIEAWCRTNFMAIDKAKFDVIFLAIHALLSEKDKLLGNIEGVPLITSYKYLGVHLTKILQLKVHLEYVCTKIRKF